MSSVLMIYSTGCACKIVGIVQSISLRWKINQCTVRDIEITFLKP